MIGKLNTRPQASAPEREHFRTEHLRADLGARTARGGAVMVAAQGLKFAINIGATVVLARLLTPHDYGLIGMVFVVTGFITLFKSMGLSAATMQRAEVSSGQVSTLFWINVAVGVLLCLVAVAAAPGVAWFFGEPSLTWITAALGFAFVFGGLSVQHEALLKRQMRFAALAAADVASMAGGMSVALVLAWRGAGYWALVANQLVLSFAYCVGVWAACRWRPGRPVRGAGVRAMLAFGRDITGQGVFIYFARNLDNLLIGRFWGAAQLALYAKAYQLLLLPIEQLSSPLNGVAVPALSRLHDSPERYRRAYLRLLEKVAMVTMPGVALMIVTSDWLVRVVLGPQWDETARIFMLLGFVGLFEPVANTLGWLLLSQGRTRHMLQWGVINGTITSASIIAGLPWGAVGVAASYALVGLCVRTPLVFWFVGRTGPVRVGDFYRTIAPSALAALCVMLALLAFRRLAPAPNHLLGLVLSSALALTVSLLIFLALPRGRRALQDLRGLFPLLLKRAA